MNHEAGDDDIRNFDGRVVGIGINHREKAADQQILSGRCFRKRKIGHLFA